MENTLNTLRANQSWTEVRSSYSLIYEPHALGIFNVLDRDYSGFMDIPQFEECLGKFQKLRDQDSKKLPKLKQSQSRLGTEGRALSADEFIRLLKETQLIHLSE